MTNLSNWRKSDLTKNQQNPFSKMQAALDKMMRDFYSNFEAPSYSPKEFESIVISPAIDIIDDERSFKVEVEMPGMGAENIDVAIYDRILHIKGEKETSQQDKDKNYAMREIHYGCYKRAIRLPDSVDIEHVKASFKKGMLWVELPKKAGAVTESKKIKVEKI